MRKHSVMGRFSITAVMALALPAFAAAQHGGGFGAHGSAPVAAGRSGAMMSRAGSAPAHVAVRGSGHGGARVGTPIAGARSSGRINRGGNRTNSGFNGTDFNGTSFQNVPGLGFDYPHLAAVNGNRRGRGGRFDGAPFGFGGFLLDSPGIIEVPSGDSGVAEDQIPNDPPIDDGTDVAAAPRRSRAPREPVQPEAAPAPPEDVEQYVLVRQDGGLVFAVAYTWQNGTLRYITPDGLRHTIKRDALDLNATQQFNEQRGLNFQAPA
ncbi:MAG: hypothetical protein JWO71_316 [Candidatus Acidoferrum typicum]|nr:hypothetical protein [Candidatus Acidoferrum typicum]